MNKPTSVWFTGVWLSEYPGYSKRSVTVCGANVCCQTRTLSCLGFLAFERSVQRWRDKRENCVFTKAIFQEEISGILIHKVTYKPLIFFSRCFPCAI